MMIFYRRLIMEYLKIERGIFLVAILDHNKIFKFEQGNPTNKVLKDFLENSVDDRFYLTYTFDLNDGKHLIKGKNNHIYDLEINNYYKGKKSGKDLNIKFNQCARIFSENGYAPTLTANNTADNCKFILRNNNFMRIRKITSKEAWRLMGFSDEDYGKASCYVSEYQLYHQAGNSIVVSVIYSVLKQLFI